MKKNSDQPPNNFYSKEHFIWGNEKSLEKVLEISNSHQSRKLSTGFPLSARGGPFSHRGTIYSTNT